MIVQGPLNPASIIPVKRTQLRAWWQFRWDSRSFPKYKTGVKIGAMHATADGAANGARAHEQSIEIVWGIPEVPNVERRLYHDGTAPLPR